MDTTEAMRKFPGITLPGGTANAAELQTSNAVTATAGFAMFVTMKKYTALLATCILGIVSLSLAQDKDGKKGFRFPGGDGEAGRAAFISLNCVQCHTVKNVLTDEPKGKRRLQLELGAEQRFVKNYEDIITAITNPKHVIQEQYREILSKAELAGGIEPLMPDLTKDMSARQLIDLVVFLDQAYLESLKGYRK